MRISDWSSDVCSSELLEIGTLRQDALEPAEQEVDVEAAFVRLVDDDRVVAVQQMIAAKLGEQDAVGHQLDHRALGDAAIEARSEERRVGKEGVSTCRSGWSAAN